MKRTISVLVLIFIAAIPSLLLYANYEPKKDVDFVKKAFIKQQTTAPQITMVSNFVND